MDWSKIKTIFILAFLILDVYLLYEFIKLRDSNQYELIPETSIENKLKAQEIEYAVLPKNVKEEKYLSAKPMVFSEEELKANKLNGQRILTGEGTTLEAVLEDPVFIGEKADQGKLSSLVKNHVLFGDQYAFWGREDNKITYYQQYDGKFFYKNLNGELTFFLNDEDEIVSYRQTLLVDIQELEKVDKLIQPLNAIEILLNNGALKPKTNITAVESGYYTYVEQSTSQVLTPVWRIMIENEESLFISGIDGQIIDLNYQEKNKVE